MLEFDSGIIGCGLLTGLRVVFVTAAAVPAVGRRYFGGMDLIGALPARSFYTALSRPESRAWKAGDLVERDMLEDRFLKRLNKKARDPVFAFLSVNLIDDTQEIELAQRDSEFLDDLPPYRLLDRLQPIHFAAGKPPTVLVQTAQTRDICR